MTLLNRILFHIRVISLNTVLLVISKASQPYKKPTNLCFLIAHYILRMFCFILTEAVSRFHMRVISPFVFEILKCILNWKTISDRDLGSFDLRSLVQKNENKVKVKGQGHIINFDFGLFSLLFKYCMTF